MRPTPGLCPFPPKGQIRQLLRGSPPGANPADIGGVSLRQGPRRGPCRANGTKSKTVEEKGSGRSPLPSHPCPTTAQMHNAAGALLQLVSLVTYPPCDVRSVQRLRQPNTKIWPLRFLALLRPLGRCGSQGQRRPNESPPSRHQRLETRSAPSDSWHPHRRG